MLWTVDPESHGFGKLVAVGHKKRRDAQAFVEPDGLVRRQRTDRNVIQFDELTPWPVLLQERLHARHGVDGNGAAPDYLATQMNQPGVMANVSVRQENARETRRLFAFGEIIKQP